MFNFIKKKIDTEDKFRDIIRKGTYAYGNSENSIQKIKKILKKYSDKEIINFGKILFELLKTSHCYNCYELAKLCLLSSDDSFLYFRLFLILEGKEKFYLAIKEPERYLSLCDKSKRRNNNRESLLYIISEILEERGKNNLYKEINIDYDNGGRLTGNKRSFNSEKKNDQEMYPNFLAMENNITKFIEKESEQQREKMTNKSKENETSLLNQKILLDEIEKITKDMQGFAYKDNDEFMKLREKLRYQLKNIKSNSVFSQHNAIMISSTLQEMRKYIVKHKG